LTAMLAAIDSSKLGIGSDADLAAWKQRGGTGQSFALKPPTPVVWFFGLVLMRIPEAVGH